jgi:hypothetical protein
MALASSTAVGLDTRRQTRAIVELELPRRTWTDRRTRAAAKRLVARVVAVARG